MGLFDNSGAANDLRDQARSIKREYMDMIPGLEAQYQSLIETTMAPIEREQELYRTRRGYRDPLQEFSAQKGLRSAVSGQTARQQQAAGLGGASRLMGTQMVLQAAAQGYQQSVSMRAQEMQRNTAALHDLLKTGGAIKSQLGMAQLQGVTGIRTGALGTYASMMTEAAKLAAQPSAFAGMLEGALMGGFGGGLFGGDDTDTDTGGGTTE